MRGIVADDGDLGRADEDIVSHDGGVAQIESMRRNLVMLTSLDARNVLNEGVDARSGEVSGRIPAC